MARIRKKKLSDGTTAYLVVWIDPTGAERTRQFSQRQTSKPAEEAKKYKIRIEGELLAGTYVDPSHGRVTFREWALQCREDAHSRRSTDERVERLLIHHAFPLIGDMRMGAVRRRDVQNMVNSLTVKPVGGPRNGPRHCLAPSYVQNIYLVVAGIFRAAVVEGIIPTSPCVKIRLPEVTKGEIIIPTPQQVEIVAARAPKHYSALVLTDAGTGLRSGELRALDLERLRVLERAAKVDRTIHTPPGEPHYYGPPKTDAGYRTVPLTQSYAEIVAAHLARWGTGVDGLVFHNRRGRPITNRLVSGALSPILRDLGFPVGSGLHVFRHYYASGLIAAGLDVQTVMRLLGHQDSSETLETYGHLWHDHDERAREAVESAFPLGPASPPGVRRSASGPVTRVPKVSHITGQSPGAHQVGGR